MRQLAARLARCLVLVSGMSSNDVAAGEAADGRPMSHTPGEHPISIAVFNGQVAQAHRLGEAWTLSARSVALGFVGADCDCEERAVDEPPSDGRSPRTVVIIDRGLHDDSLAAFRFQIVLTMSPKGLWRVDRVDESWSCRSHRGHADFSIAWCE